MQKSRSICVMVSRGLPLKILQPPGNLQRPYRNSFPNFRTKKTGKTRAPRFRLLRLRMAINQASFILTSQPNWSSSKANPHLKRSLALNWNGFPIVRTMSSSARQTRSGMCFFQEGGFRQPHWKDHGCSQLLIYRRISAIFPMMHHITPCVLRFQGLLKAPKRGFAQASRRPLV